MPNAVCSVPRLFADDTCLLLHHPDLTILHDNLNREISLLHEWCNSNKLTINPLKSHLLLTPPNLNKNNLNFSIMLNNTNISTESNVNYLGISLDSRLNFQSHINIMEQKISRGVGILYKLKPILPQSALLKLYYSLIHPYLIYGIIVWGSTFPTYLRKLSILQNKAVKLIGDGNYSEKATPFYIKLKILKIPELFKLEVAKLVHKHVHNNLPIPLSNLFKKSHESSTRSTRFSSNPFNLSIPLYRSSRLQRCIRYQGAKVWNSIPTEIRKLPKTSFHSNLKKHFIELYTTDIFG